MTAPLSQISCLNLFEAEFRQVLAAVVEFDNEHPASPFPTLVSFPDVAVLVCGRVVTQTAAARVEARVYVSAGRAGLVHVYQQDRGGQQQRNRERNTLDDLIVRTACRTECDGVFHSRP